MGEGGKGQTKPSHAPGCLCNLPPPMTMCGEGYSYIAYDDGSYSCHSSQG